MPKKSIKKPSKKILAICKDDNQPYKENQQVLHELFFEIRNYKMRKKSPMLTEKELSTILELHRELCLIKNRKASSIEEELMRLVIVTMPTSLYYSNDEVPDELEVLKDEYETPPRLMLTLNSMLLKYAKEILNGPTDKSKRYKKRIKESLRLLDNLNDYFLIPNVENYFWDRISDKDADVQFFALNGLENYYSYTFAKAITKKEIALLEQIIATTQKEVNASSPDFGRITFFSAKKPSSTLDFTRFAIFAL